MTRRTFYSKLRKISKNFKWQIANGALRGTTTAVAGVPMYFCPITAVCKIETGKSYFSCSFRYAARDMGLSEEDAIEIATNSDGDSNNPTRKALLTACLVPERTDP